MDYPTSLYEFIYCDHALVEMKRRRINLSEVRRVLRNPEQSEPVRPGRVVYQSRFNFPESSDKCYLIRVFVDIDRQPAEVVTAYRTSKVSKYWKE